MNVKEIEAILDCTLDAIIVIDGNGLIKYFNRAAEGMFGYKRDEAMGKELHMVFASEDAFREYQQRLPEFQRTGQCNMIGRRIEINAKRRDGIIFPAEASIVSYRIDGQWYAAGAIRNITERKTVEDTVRESEKRFRTIFEKSPIGISIANPEGEIITCNNALQRMLGYSYKELCTKFINITYPDDREKSMKLFNDMVRGKIDEFTLEKRYIRKDGSIMWANVTVNAVRDAQGRFLYNFALIEDITEKKRLEDQLRHVQKMEAIGHLAGGIAHDFNNLLTAITGYANLLKIKLHDKPSLRHLAEQILEIAERGAHLTKGLLTFSRRQVMEMRPVNLNRIVENTCKIIHRLIGEDIEVKINLSKKSLMVMADTGQIEQILFNLVSNARDAMPDGGILTIETGQKKISKDEVIARGYGSPGEYAFISVSDTGMGIPQEHIPKIFDPFFTTKDVGEGTGLGLSIVYGIVKQHNGYIDVFSELNKGTSVRVYFPLLVGVEEEEIPIKRTKRYIGTETILIAEDDESTRKSLKSVLEENGFSTIEASDGHEAVEKFKQYSKNIDLLILDVVMPKKDAVEAYEEIRAIRPDIKVLFISGYSSDYIDKYGIIQRGLPYISKPVSPHNLLKKIREIFTE